MTPTRLSRTWVLVADDSDRIRQRLRLLVEDLEDVRIVGEAENKAEVIRLFEMHRPDAVVLDLLMPDFDGIEVLRWIKRKMPCCVVIMFTNYCTLEFRVACQRSGADHFFNKATDADRVVETLSNLAAANSATLLQSTGT